MELECNGTETDFVVKKRGRKTSSMKVQDQCWADNVTAETNGGFQQVRSRLEGHNAGIHWVTTSRQ